jgi:hypothetical protein
MAVLASFPRSAIGRGKNYRKHLEPCQEILRPCVEAFGYEADC